MITVFDVLKSVMLNSISRNSYRCSLSNYMFFGSLGIKRSTTRLRGTLTTMEKGNRQSFYLFEVSMSKFPQSWKGFSDKVGLS